MKTRKSNIRAKPKIELYHPKVDDRIKMGSRDERVFEVDKACGQTTMYTLIRGPNGIMMENSYSSNGNGVWHECGATEIRATMRDDAEINYQHGMVR